MAEVDKVKVVAVKPFVFNIVNNEGHIGRHHVGLYGAEIEADDLCTGIIIGS